MLLRADRKSEFIEPYTTDRSVYVVKGAESRSHASLPWVCSTDDVALNQQLNTEVMRSNNQSYKTMRLALSCNAEYTIYHGGQVADALAAMNATMTRVNGIMEKDLSIHLNIIASSSSVIFTNAATDPYTPFDSGNGIDDWNQQLQTTLTNSIGNANYDIGHMFGSDGGGGNAGCIGCVCVNPTIGTPLGKGSGITSPADGIPEGDNFDVDYVVHEMGHQLGGNHTFSFSAENNTVNVEPGSGSTIMAYAGITGATDVQAHSDPYFTYRSILQIQTNMATKTCPVSTPIANTPPTINAGADFTIPKGTAFILKGTGSDAQGDTITYCWEQNDDATVVGAAASYPSPTKTDGPNFRSVNPSTSPNRYMPAFSSVLAGNLTTMWETVSTVARTMNFTLTGRDSNGPTSSQTQTDAMIVTVNATAGPFQVTYPNIANETWIQNTAKTVTWDVAGTTGNGINTSNVNILFSSDAGETFTTLVANTPNDGSEAITVPNVAAPYCRIMIEPVGNIYYAVSKSFAIGYTVTVTNTCNTYTGTVTAAAVAGPDTQYAVQGTVDVPDNVTISDVNMTINITHPKVNDLYVGLVKPNSTVVDCQIYTQSCPTVITQNMVCTWDDAAPTLACATLGAGNSYKPANQLLEVFNGGQSQGLWRLAIADVTAANSGTLNSWSLQICSTTTTVTLATDNFELTDFSLYPNPNNGSFNVKFTPDGSNDIKINVHDIQGRRILAKTYPATGAFEENLQLQSVQSGVYLVTVQNGANKTVKRVVVQ